MKGVQWDNLASCSPYWILLFLLWLSIVLPSAPKDSACCTKCFPFGTFPKLDFKQHIVLPSLSSLYRLKREESREKERIFPHVSTINFKIFQTILEVSNIAHLFHSSRSLAPHNILSSTSSLLNMKSRITIIILIILQPQDGRHQEEDASHEAWEGQCDGPRRCLRAAGKGRQPQGREGEIDTYNSPSFFLFLVQNNFESQI